MLLSNGSLRPMWLLRKVGSHVIHGCCRSLIIGSLINSGCRSCEMVLSTRVAATLRGWFSPTNWLPLLILGSLPTYGCRSLRVVLSLILAALLPIGSLTESGCALPAWFSPSNWLRSYKLVLLKEGGCFSWLVLLSLVAVSLLNHWWWFNLVGMVS